MASQAVGRFYTRSNYDQADDSPVTVQEKSPVKAGEGAQTLEESKSKLRSGRGEMDKAK